ncbi:hypothetical protein G5V59_19200 [Nocardioides sp. W3-2-3]|uniref:hypothetical protein n=1 Tax=Nocardioides convexus TaxID=2712224 RepID=UPI00241879D6|nr:hypothetical protein [Nocardioides convexus]NHA01258.1 hypothetical protein [Nocardioides convexus]
MQNNDTGEWVNDEPTAHNVKIFGSAATHVHDKLRIRRPDPLSWRCPRPRAHREPGRTRRPARSTPWTSWSLTAASARSASRSSTSPRASSAPPARPRPA